MLLWPRSLLTAALALALGACSSAAGAPGGGGSRLEDLELEVTRLQGDLEEVAAAQSEADLRLANVVQAVRELDSIVNGLRDPERVDEFVDHWARVDAAVGAAVPEEVRDGYFAVAFAVDEARLGLHQTRQRFEQKWEDEYLSAEDDALVAVRSYAQTADALAQVLNQYWPGYVQLHETTATFIEQRYFYRDAREAADAYELAVRGLLPALADAQVAIGAAVDQREAAAAEVNAAFEVAAELWADRPVGPAPTP